MGDPRQLPPTVLSRSAEAARLSQSMFERLQVGAWEEGEGVGTTAAWAPCSELDLGWTGDSQCSGAAGECGHPNELPYRTPFCCAESRMPCEPAGPAVPHAPTHQQVRAIFFMSFAKAHAADCGVEVVCPVASQAVLLMHPTHRFKKVCWGPDCLCRSLHVSTISGSCNRLLQMKKTFIICAHVCSFPSAFFYSQDLKDGISASARTAPWHASSSALGPLVVWDLPHGREGRGGGRGGRGGGGGSGGSLSNRAEAELAVGLYRGGCSTWGMHYRVTRSAGKEGSLPLHVLLVRSTAGK